MTEESRQKKRIAILGGGVSSMVTAFELTNVPGWKDHYEIDLYCMGHLLGGKGSSGRNADLGQRIEEHGLHIFFGFYENAFRVMRAAYRELGRYPDAPLSTWKDAFHKHGLVVMLEKVGGEWHNWPLPFPEDDGEPGEGGVFPTPWEYLERIINALVDLFDQRWLRRGEEQGHGLGKELEGSLEAIRKHVDAIIAGGEGGDVKSPLEALTGLVLGLVKKVASAVVQPLVDAESGFLHLAHELFRALPKDPSSHKPGDHRAILWLLKRFRTWIFEKLEEEAENSGSFDLYVLLVGMDFGITVMIGMFEDGLIIPPVNWYKIDDWDFRDWLAHHGAAPITVRSAPVRTLEDAIFSSGVGVGAGTILYCAFRLLFTYKGALLFKMQAGMGDTIFGPLYTVLKRRGVRFHFFHRVDSIELSKREDGKERRVEKIHVGIQATTHNDAEYEPLVDVKGLPCWPDRPRYAQLVQGEALKKGKYILENWWTKWKDPVDPIVLEAGKDFDHVVLGIGVGAFPYICKDLIDDDANPRFKAMVENVATAQTNAAQLWFTPNLEGLGWPMKSPVTIAYVEPYDTWADMSQLIDKEDWPASHPVGNIAYLCSRMPDDGPLPPRTDHDYPFRQQRRAKEHARDWLTRRVHPIWPWAAQTNDPGTLNWDWLADLEDRQGEARFDSGYYRAPWNPSERYVLSVAGSNKFRLKPDQSGYQNLTLTGDWTLTSIAAGCVECAMMSGMHASRHISGYPKKIVGDWLYELPESEVEQVLPAPPRVRHHRGRTRTRPHHPDFIVRDGDLMALQPYLAKKNTMYSYLVGADYGALQRMCDRYLNIGPTVYKPLFPACMFVAARIEHMRSDLPGHIEGWVKEEDFGFWVPLAAGREADGRYWVDRIVTFQPYMFVDSGVAAEGGREIYGFQKAVGTLTGPGEGSPRFGVNSMAIPKFSPETQARPLDLIDVRPSATNGQRVDLPQDFADLAAVEAAIKEALYGLGTEDGIPLPDWEFGIHLLEDILFELMPMVFLKQFPDALDGTRACYQALVEAPARVVGPVTGGWIPGEYDVRVHPYDSHQFIDTLGLHTEAQGDGWRVAKSHFHLWLDFDFRMENATSVWEES